MILFENVLSAICNEVRVMAALVGQTLMLRALSFYPERAQRSSRTLQINPKRTLPPLQDGDRTLTDSTDTLRHLTADRPEWQKEGGDWLIFVGGLNDSLGLAWLHDIMGYAADIALLRDQGARALRALEERQVAQRLDGLSYLTGVRPTIVHAASRAPGHERLRLNALNHLRVSPAGLFPRG